MKTVQMTLDEKLIRAVDRISRKLKTNRSAFTRAALREAIARYRVEEMERRHRRGYESHPPEAGEFSAWEDEQDWGEA